MAAALREGLAEASQACEEMDHPSAPALLGEYIDVDKRRRSTGDSGRFSWRGSFSLSSPTFKADTASLAESMMASRATTELCEAGRAGNEYIAVESSMRDAGIELDEDDEGTINASGRAAQTRRRSGSLPQKRLSANDLGVIDQDATTTGSTTTSTTTSTSRTPTTTVTASATTSETTSATTTPATSSTTTGTSSVTSSQTTTEVEPLYDALSFPTPPHSPDIPRADATYEAPAVDWKQVRPSMQRRLTQPGATVPQIAEAVEGAQRCARGSLVVFDGTDAGSSRKAAGDNGADRQVLGHVYEDLGCAPTVDATRPPGVLPPVADDAVYSMLAPPSRSESKHATSCASEQAYEYGDRLSLSMPPKPPKHRYSLITDSGIYEHICTVTHH